MAVVMITGAGGGIGLASVLAFARRGDTVIATIRSPDRSQRLSSVAAVPELDIHVMPLDVTRSEGFSPMVEQIAERHGQIDVLVNNAGVHRAGALEDIDEEMLRQIMEVNCIGPLLLSRAVLPTMRRQRRGLIIMMSSLSGIAGLPGDVPYTASKFALEGAAEALRQEVARWNIRVALVQGGLYATNIMSANLPDDEALPEHFPKGSPYKSLVRWQLANLRARLPEAFEPARVAELFVQIAQSDSPQLRWPADEVAIRVLETMLGQTDHERRAFLEQIADAGWWLRGDDNPPKQEST